MKLSMVGELKKLLDIFGDDSDASIRIANLDVVVYEAEFSTELNALILSVKEG